MTVLQIPSKQTIHAARGRERGIALIIVLGLVAVIGAWAATAAYEDMIALRRAGNMQDAMRAVQASRSALALATMTLRQDARDSSIDDLDELWAMDSPPFPMDEGMVSGHIIDSNRYVNLNDLVDRQGQVQVQAVQLLKRLFRQLELDEGLIDALADWEDADEQPNGVGGAEDSAYYDKPYRVKNAPLDNWDELGMVKGFDAGVLEKLAEVAVVMPVAENSITPVNLNTAPAMVLMALFPNLSEADAEMVLASRPYADVNAAIQGKTWAEGVNPARLSVVSDGFKVQTQARFGRVLLREEFVVQRQAETMSLVSRQRMGWGQP